VSAVLGWVREIVLVVLLGWVLEMLVPRDEFRRYVRLVIGLLVLVAVIRPALNLLGAARPGAFRVGRDAQAADLVERGVSIQKGEEGKTLALYAQKVGEEAAAVAETVPGVRTATGEAQIDEDPSSAAFGEVTSLVVAVIPGGSIEVGGDGSRSPPSGLAGQVKKALSLDLGIDERAVTVTVQKGG